MSTTKELSKRQARREQIRRQEQRGRITGISLMSLGAIFLAFLFIYPNLKPVGDITIPEALARSNVKFNSTGNPDAPIKIDEYSDFQCPYCRQFYEDTEVKLIETYVKDGTVLFTYHSFGAFIGPESGRSAEAAYCAGDQNKFWEMHDIILVNQTGENVGAYTDRRLLAFADAIDLDKDEFNSCFTGGTYVDLIAQDAKDGIAAGIAATPSFVLSYTVNGETKTKVLQGAQPFSAFEQEIKSALAEMGK